MWLAGAAVIVAAGRVALWRALHPETAATIELTSTNGAAIDVDGQPIGIAIDGRLAVPHLLAGRPYRVVARLPGYEPRRAVVTPHAGTNELAFALDAAASVIVDSQPSAATVTIDGLAVGSTPLELATLAPGTTVSIAFDHPGYRHATARVQVPGRGHQQHVVQALEPAPEAVRVHVTSTPPGAAIVRDGQLPTSDRTYTPADVFVDADRVQHFTLVMSKHSPFAIPPFTPGRDTPSVQVGGELR
jgi:hypothetical protein